MEIFWPVFGLLLTVVLAMSVGVIVSNRRLKGSCGGLNLVPGLDACPVCGKDAEAARRAVACGNAEAR